jgi:hypothetical protein
MNEFLKKKIIPGLFWLMIQTLVFAGDGVCTEIIISPEMAARIYFDAYVAQDWEVVTEYMHPDLLQNLKRRIIEMVKEVSVDTRRVLLREYQARSMAALEQMPARPLYILYLKNRWKGIETHSLSMLEKTEFIFIGTVRITHEECLVEFKTSVVREDQLFNKVQVYHMKKYEGKWKIYDTEGLKRMDTDMPSDLEVL